MNNTEKIKYLLWAARRWPSADRTCPGCQAAGAQLLKRKYAVTSLYRCNTCRLMFRVPKGSLVDDALFYEAGYEQGSTTELPDEVRLEVLKDNWFRDIGQNYAGHIAVLQAIGIEPGCTVYDYGSSWGYGSWQFRQAGYEVYSYEIACTRARFAQEKLGCRMLADPRAVPRRVDCLFASHVMEHLADPNLLWRTARDVLQPDGVIVVFVPNGEPVRAQMDPGRYHQLWGRVHPLFLTAASLGWMAEQYGFSGAGYSSPYDLDGIARWRTGRLDGEELLFIARRKP